MADAVLAGMENTVANGGAIPAVDTTPSIPQDVPNQSARTEMVPSILAVELGDKTGVIITSVGNAPLESQEKQAIIRIALRAFDRRLKEILGEVRKNAGVRKRTRRVTTNPDGTPRRGPGRPPKVKPAEEAVHVSQ